MTDSETTDAAQTDTPEAAAPATRAAKGKEKSGGAVNAVWMGTAVGIGSAALVAALMYAKRRK